MTRIHPSVRLSSNCQQNKPECVVPSSHIPTISQAVLAEKVGILSLCALSFGCSKDTVEPSDLNPTNHTTQHHQPTSPLTDPDYIRWRDALMTPEKKKALHAFLNSTPKSTSKENLDLTFETKFELSVVTSAIVRTTEIINFVHSADSYVQPLLEKNGTAGEDLPNTPEDRAYLRAKQLEVDPNYLALMNKAQFKEGDYDCDEIAAAFLSTILFEIGNEIKDGESCRITLNSGMLYEPSLPGKGGGHFWFTLTDGRGSRILDPSIENMTHRITTKDIADPSYLLITAQTFNLLRVGNLAKIASDPIVIVRAP